MNIDEITAALKPVDDATAVAERIVNELLRERERPMFIAQSGAERFHYVNRDSVLVQLLKCVRAISGINAAMALLRAGHTPEVAVMLRVIDDMIDEIQFLMERDENGALPSKQAEFVEAYFSEPVPDTKQQPPIVWDGPRVSKKHIRASQARHLSAAMEGNTFAAQQMMERMDSILSRSVHGSYWSTMELYEGSSRGGRDAFRMRGMLGTPLVEPALLALRLHTSVFIADLTLMAIDLDKPSIVLKLREVHRGLNQL